MTHKQRFSASQEAHSTAGLLSSLSHALPNPSGSLGRAARAMADRLSTGQASRADHDRAAGLLERLLDESDTGQPWDDLDLLDSRFDD